MFSFREIIDIKSSEILHVHINRKISTSKSRYVLHKHLNIFQLFDKKLIFRNFVQTFILVNLKNNHEFIIR